MAGSILNGREEKILSKSTDPWEEEENFPFRLKIRLQRLKPISKVGISILNQCLKGRCLSILIGPIILFASSMKSILAPSHRRKTGWRSRFVQEKSGLNKTPIPNNRIQ